MKGYIYVCMSDIPASLIPKMGTMAYQTLSLEEARTWLQDKIHNNFREPVCAIKGTHRLINMSLIVGYEFKESESARLQPLTDSDYILAMRGSGSGEFVVINLRS